MPNFKLIIQYDGTSYSGWQKQKNQPTIQGEIEKTLFKIVGEPVSVIGAGRTDSGVHATGQVANFKSNTKLSSEKLFNAINWHLPKDIRIFNCTEVSDDFHARFSANKREYKYIIYNDIQYPPFIKNYVHFIKKPLDIEKLKSSLELFIGEHNFTSFSSANDESNNKIRTIYDISIEKKNNEIIKKIELNYKKSKSKLTQTIIEGLGYDF